MGSNSSLELSSGPKAMLTPPMLLQCSITTIWPSTSTLLLIMSHLGHIACNNSMHNYSKIFKSHEQFFIHNTEILTEKSCLLKSADTEDKKTTKILPYNNYLLFWFGVFCANLWFTVILLYKEERVVFQTKPRGFKMCFSLSISLTSRISLIKTNRTILVCRRWARNRGYLISCSGQKFKTHSAAE